jgi:hypothetical protein
MSVGLLTRYLLMFRIWRREVNVRRFGKYFPGSAAQLERCVYGDNMVYFDQE